jgi:hypothetical protein
MCQRTIETRSRNHCCRGKTVNIAHSDCVSVGFVIQNTKPMHCIKLSSGTFLTVPHFSTLFHKWHDFQKKVTERELY